jgi:uncharacterized Tic20 family protein
MAEKNQHSTAKNKISSANYVPLIHLSITATIIIPFLFLIVALIAYLTSTNQRVQAAGREVLNFGITLILIPFFLAGLFLSIIGIPLGLMVALLTVPYFILAFLVFPIIGAMRSADGVDYRYPLTIRFFKD